MSRTSVHGFFLACHMLITWFKLSRVKLYRKDLKGNKDYFELVGGSTYQGFELPRVKLQYMYEGNPGEIDFGSSLCEVRVSGSQLYLYRKWDFVQDLPHRENNLPEIRLIPPNCGLIV